MKKLEKILQSLRNLNTKKVFIQYPEGLTGKIIEIAKKIEENGIETVLCIEPTYGACDIRDVEAKRIGCDVIIHIGHAPFGVKSELPVIYWDYLIDVNPIPLLEKNISLFKSFKSIGLTCSIQYCKSIKKVKEFFEANGFKVFIAKGEKYAGQILGCRHYAAESIEKKVDCFVVISAGKFHALGLSLKTEKPVILVDAESWKVIDMEKEKKRFEKIIAWNVSALKDAKKVGILVSWKKGQLKNPFKLKEKLEKVGKEVYILAFDSLSPEKVEGLKLDLLINTACPRIGIDDLERYKIPILNEEYLREYL